MRIRMMAVIAALALVAGSASAQEFSAFGITGRQVSSPTRASFGYGGSVALYGRLVSGAPRDSALGTRIGVRLSVAQLRSSRDEQIYYPRLEPLILCAVTCSPVPPRRINSRLLVQQLALVLVPIEGRNTRIEVSTGLAYFNATGDVRTRDAGYSAGVGLSQRLLKHTPVWATLAYDRHRRFTTTDVASATPPLFADHAFRLAVSYDAGRQ